MKHPIRTLLRIAALLVLPAYAAPAWAACPFASPIQQGGLLGRPAGSLLTAVPVGGFFWELGLGHPEILVGNDSDPTVSGLPAGMDALWIRQPIRFGRV